MKLKFTNCSFLPGIIITGGFINKKYQNLAEAFNSRTKDSIRVGKLNHARAGHTFCNNMVCGGTYFNPEAYKSCERFDLTGSFTTLPVRLVERRVNHLCWGLKSGDVLLIGGMGQRHSPNTERVSRDGSSSSLDFKLPYRIL